MAYTLIFLLKKCICKSYSHFFSKNTCELDIVLTRTVKILSTKELVKLTTLWTTGPWSPYCERGSWLLAFLWFVACVLSAMVCLLFLMVSLVVVCDCADYSWRSSDFFSKCVCWVCAINLVCTRYHGYHGYTTNGLFVEKNYQRLPNLHFTSSFEIEKEFWVI